MLLRPVGAFAEPLISRDLADTYRLLFCTTFLEFSLGKDSLNDVTVDVR